MKILEFQSEAEAQAALVIVNQMAEAFFAEQGYTITDINGQHAVVGKNAASNEDNPEALTLTWDEVKQSPDDTFYFTSLTGSQYEGGMDDFLAALSAQSVSVVEKDFPPAWIVDEDV